MSLCGRRLDAGAAPEVLETHDMLPKSGQSDTTRPRDPETRALLCRCSSIKDDDVAILAKVARSRYRSTRLR